MSDTGKQNPLGVNSLGSLLQNTGLTINPVAAGYMGSSKYYANYNPGTVVTDTVLRLLTYAINDGYNRGVVDNTTYDNLISIGSGTLSIPSLTIVSTTTTSFVVTHGTSTVSQFPVNTYIKIGGSVSDSANADNYNGYWLITASSPGTFTVETTTLIGTATTQGTIYYGNSIPALGNSKAPTFTYTGAGNQFASNTTYYTQSESWNPYNHTTGVTQWGYARLIALQAWNEFNWNGDPAQSAVQYKDFTQSFMQTYSFIEYTNVGINALKSAPSFLKGTYSNMNDLISADITGVSLATNAFGQDLITSGKAINLQRIDAFGLPSVLLATLKQYNAISQSISLALIASGLQPTEVDQIISGIPASAVQEQKIYGAFLIIQGVDLTDALIPLNCKTKGLTTLADLLNPIKLFPNSYATLTVPIFNANPGPTNSKTYYPIYGTGSVNPILTDPTVIGQTAGPQIPLGEPPKTPRNVSYSVSTTSSSTASAVEFVTGGGSSTYADRQAEYQKYKSTPPGPGYEWDEGYGTWRSPDEVLLKNMSRTERREIYSAYMKEKLPGQDFIVSGNPGQNPEDVLAWAKENGLIKPYGS